ncbi:DUF3789 domain-containing protein [Serratia sp. 1D1416]
MLILCFISGVFVGTFIGVFVMCLCRVSAESEIEK